MTRPDRAAAEQAWNTQKARAWAAGAGRLVKPINVPEMSVPAIERATDALRAALDKLEAEKAAVRE